MVALSPFPLGPKSCPESSVNLVEHSFGFPSSRGQRNALPLAGFYSAAAAHRLRSSGLLFHRRAHPSVEDRGQVERRRIALVSRRGGHALLLLFEARRSRRAETAPASSTSKKEMMNRKCGAYADPGQFHYLHLRLIFILPAMQFPVRRFPASEGRRR